METKIKILLSPGVFAGLYGAGVLEYASLDQKSKDNIEYILGEIFENNFTIDNTIIDKFTPETLYEALFDYRQAILEQKDNYFLDFDGTIKSLEECAKIVLKYGKEEGVYVWNDKNRAFIKDGKTHNRHNM